MTYLTYEQYKKLTLDPIEESDFDVLCNLAVTDINVLTRHRIDFETLSVTNKELIKLATFHQVQYFENNGTDIGTYSAQSESVRIGNYSESTSNSQNHKPTLHERYSPHAYNLLLQTGLMFAGVDSIGGVWHG